MIWEISREDHEIFFADNNNGYLDGSIQSLHGRWIASLRYNASKDCVGIVGLKQEGGELFIKHFCKL